MSDSDWDEWDSNDEIYNDFDEMQELAQLNQTVSYFVIDCKEILKRQINAIDELADILCLNRSQASYLLLKNDWDIQKTSQDFLNQFNNDQFLMARTNSIIQKDELKLCLLCYSECQSNKLIGLECQHMYCRDCYQSYLITKVQQGKECIFTTCPDFSCNIAIPEEIFNTLLPEKELQNYNRFRLHSYVEMNSKVKWCPAPGCEFAVECPKVQSRYIECKCGYTWCFNCAQECHNPISCEQYSQWMNLIKGKGDLDNAWLLANTKSCPNCNSKIQKNAGCMHMTCKCGYEFCWLCLGDWQCHGEQSGGFYACNKFQTNQAAGLYADEQRERIIAAYRAKRFEHYSNRFLDHMKSVQFGKNKSQKLDQFNDFISDLIPNFDSDNLNVFYDANKLVLQARRALCFSYALGYFLTSAAKINFYEFLQGELERTVDKLDELTEFDGNSYITCLYQKPYVSNKFFDLRFQVLNAMEVVKEHFSKSLDEMEKGFPDIVDTNEIDKDSHLSQLSLVQLGIVDNEHWTCSACTLVNSIERSRCEVCFTNRP